MPSGKVAPMAVINSNRFNFQEVIGTWVARYGYQAIAEVEDAIQDTAKESVKKLKATSPKGPGGYAKNWTYDKEKRGYKYGCVVYGKSPTYRLAHLLEYGHPIKRGGRTVGKADPIPHIKEVEEWAIDEAYDKCVTALERLSR